MVLLYIRPHGLLYILHITIMSGRHSACKTSCPVFIVCVATGGSVACQSEWCTLPAFLPWWNWAFEEEEKRWRGERATAAFGQSKLGLARKANCYCSTELRLKPQFFFLRNKNICTTVCTQIQIVKSLCAILGHKSILSEATAIICWHFLFCSYFSMKYCLLSQHLSVCNQSRSQTEDPQHQQLKQRAKEVCMYFMRERERERERDVFV